ncbi:MAG: 2-amino-4-hydroxy-6-hydroxymethyldihydropteridine diphosphokinase [SAR202 cluster bacterium Io17-Chloro-G9]|nr:MAG: 2-amino-4-hydroxy-6-hydroxymethyldihydropteridine diphosphokinase [SAR202 cluster bacterium Io17-Chloro-G9]
MSTRRSSDRPATVYLGLGSNLGCRKANLDRAVQGIREISGGHPQTPVNSLGARHAVPRSEIQRGIRVIRASSVYETEPWGFTDQGRFLNQVLEAETTISPHDLLDEIKRLENEMGREAGTRYGPRVIDIDILLYGDQVVDGPELQIPHPRLHQRAFVLVPLVELAPDMLHPALGVSISDLFHQVDGKTGVKQWVKSPSWPGRTAPVDNPL